MPFSQNSYRGIATATATNRIGLVVQTYAVRATQDGKWRITQQTGAAAGSLNEETGTDPNAPGNAAMVAGSQGLPYENTEVPETGPLGGVP